MDTTKDGRRCNHDRKIERERAENRAKRAIKLRMKASSIAYRRKRDRRAEAAAANSDANDPGPQKGKKGGSPAPRASSAPLLIPEPQHPKLKITRRPKGHEPLTQLIAESLRRENEAAAGCADAVDEHEKAEQLEKAAARRDELLAQEQARSAEVAGDAERLVGLAFHPILPDSHMRSVAEVAPKLEALTVFPWPHRAAEIVEVGVHSAHEVILDDTGAKPRVLVRNTQNQLEKEVAAMEVHQPQTLIRVTLKVHNYGFLFRKCESGYIHNLTINWDQWCAFRQGRLLDFSFGAVLDRVLSFRAHNKFYAAPTRQAQNADIWNDNVFAALCLASKCTITSDVDLTRDLLSKQLYATLCRRMLSGKGAMRAAGNYVVGYTTNFRDLWPEEFGRAWDRMRAGENPSKAADGMVAEILAADSGMVCGKETLSRTRAASLADFGTPGALYARMSKIFVEGIYPCFPDPHVVANRLQGLVKRLGRPQAKADEEAERREAAVAEALKRAEHERGPPLSETLCHVWDYVHEHGATWSTDQRFAFVCGAYETAAYSVSKAGQRDVAALSETVRQLGEQLARVDVFARDADAYAGLNFAARVREACTNMQAFIKAETYPYDELKACRNIVAPGHWLRGVLWMAYSGAGEAFFLAQDLTSVKHRTVQENAEITAECFEGTGEGVTVVIETDGKSFESLINKRRRGLENDVLATYAPEEAIPAIELIGDATSVLWMLKQAPFIMTLVPMRRSGEWVTSVGNLIGNACISLGSLSRVREIPLDKIKDWVRRQRANTDYRFEGDDGLIRVKISEVAAYGKALALAGVKMTLAAKDRVQDACFCGLEMLTVRGRDIIYRNPIDCLARLTCTLDCDAQSDKHDEDLLVARALSYYQLYRELPLIGAACRAILQRYRCRATELMRQATTGSLESLRGWHGWQAVAQIRRAINSRLSRFGDLMAPVPLDLISMPDDDLFLAPELEVCELVGQKLPFTANALTRWSEEIYRAFRAGVSCKIPELEAWYRTQTAAARMALLRVEGTREAVWHEVDQRFTRAASAGIRSITTRTQKVARVVGVGLTAASAVLGTAAVLGVGAAKAFVWAGLAHWWLLPLSFLGYCVACALFVAAAVLLLEWPLRWARHVVAAVTYAFLALMAVGAWETYQGWVVATTRASWWARSCAAAWRVWYRVTGWGLSRALSATLAGWVWRRTQPPPAAAAAAAAEPRRD